MNDRKALSIALARMAEVEGKTRKDRLVWDTLTHTVPGGVRTRSRRLAEEIKEAQEENGIHRPQCGQMMALEILAKLGMLLNEKEE